MNTFTKALNILLLCCSLFSFVIPASAEVVQLQPGENSKRNYNLAYDGEKLGELIITFMLDIDPESKQYLLNLAMKVEKLPDNHALVLFDKGGDPTRLFARIRNVHKVEFERGRDFNQKNTQIASFFHTKDNILVIKEAFRTGYAQFRENWAREFVVNKEGLNKNGLTDLDLHFYLNENKDNKNNLLMRLDPVKVKLHIVSESITETMVEEIITEQEDPKTEEEKIEAGESIAVLTEQEPSGKQETKTDDKPVSTDEPGKTNEPVKQDTAIAVTDNIDEERELCEKKLSSLSLSLEKLKTDYVQNAFASGVQKLSADIRGIEPDDSALRSMTETESSILIQKIKDHHNNALEISNNLSLLNNQFDVLKGDVQRQINQCEMLRNDFVAIRTRIDQHMHNITQFLSDVDKIIVRIEQLEAKVAPNMFSIRDQLRQRYGAEFNNFLFHFIELENRFTKLESDFINKRTTNRYFEWNKKRFNSRLRQITEVYESLYSELNQHRNLTQEAFNDSLGTSPSFSGTTEENIREIRAVDNRLQVGIERMKGDLEKFAPLRNPWFLIILGFIVTSILVFGSRVYLIALRKSHKKIQAERKFNSMTVIEEGDKKKVAGLSISPNKITSDGKTPIIPGKGLGHVRDKVGKDYYEIDLDSMWTDTKVTKVFIHRRCIIDSYRFFYKSLSVEGKVLEYGGYIIGGWDYDKNQPDKYHVSLEEFVEPGDDAIYSEYNLNFGGKIGIRYQNRIREIRGKSGLNFTLTAWFHSHPEIKIFLSESDLIVQERLASSDHKGALLAMVMDPNTQDDDKIAFFTGIFSYKSDYSMNNNKNDIRLIKWKSLYDWAKAPQPPDLSASYCFQMDEFVDESVLKIIHISNLAIVRLSEFTDSEKKAKQYGVFQSTMYYAGSEPNGLLFLEDIHYENDTDFNKLQGAAAVFLNLESNLQAVEKTIERLEKQPKLQLIMLYDNNDKSLLLLTRRNSDSFNRISKIKNSVPFEKIEAWPTRKR